jgi:hypothetical protein
MKPVLPITACSGRGAEQLLSTGAAVSWVAPAALTGGGRSALLAPLLVLLGGRRTVALGSTAKPSLPELQRGRAGRVQGPLGWVQAGRQRLREQMKQAPRQ